MKKSYDSDEDNILNDFYVPTLSETVKYRRLAGFFSSSALAVAAKGIAQLVRNGGDMQLIVSAKLSEPDVEAIKKAEKTPEKVLEKVGLLDLEKLEDELVRDHVRALGWLIANDRLDIKVALLCDEDGNPLDKSSLRESGIFHQKVGILEDEEGNKLSFSGSDNESARGWLSHIEEFKVFRNWNDYEREYFKTDSEKFSKFWNATALRTKVLRIPKALKEKLIKKAPDEFGKLNLEKYDKKWPIKRKVTSISTQEKGIDLWPIQENARDEWTKSGKRGILSMATGTGKTFAALGCLEKTAEQENKLFTIITAPSHTLIEQWKKSIDDFGIEQDILEAHGNALGWRNKLADEIIDLNLGNRQNLIVVSTHDTFHSKDFRKIIKKSQVPMLLVADEVHGLGASEMKKGLLENYQYRLGLSATPERYFDEKGTRKIIDYFQGISFKFSLKEAINKINPATGKTYLAPYEYKIHFVELKERELLEYREETESIRKAYYNQADEEEKDEVLTGLFTKRANIIKTADNKYQKFREILDSIEDVRHCFVYCTPRSPDQIKKAMEILESKNLIVHQMTQTESKRQSKKWGGLSERQYLLKEFEEGKYQVLISMEILDEGIDVPPTKIGILLSSSGNPRQYIQRRGRLLRHSKNKEKAIIHDIIVVPTLEPGSLDDRLLSIEKKIIKKELERLKEFSDAAQNKNECLRKLDKMESKFGVFVEG